MDTEESPGGGSRELLDEDALLLDRKARRQACQESSSPLLGIVLSLVGLMVVIALALGLNWRASEPVTGPEVGPAWAKRRDALEREPINFEHIVSGELDPRVPGTSWLRAAANDDDELLIERSGDLYVASLQAESPAARQRGGKEALHRSEHSGQLLGLPASEQVIPLASEPSVRSIRHQTWKLSPSKRFVLLACEQRQRFRLSFTAEYFVHDTRTKSAAPVQLTTGEHQAASERPGDLFGEQLDSPAERPVRFQLAEWFSATPGDEAGEPGRERADSLLLAQDGDLYVLADVARGAQFPRRLTFTGRPGRVYNGLAEWPYEENISAGKPAFAISPNGRHLAYLSFNDSGVSELPIMWLDDRSAGLEDLRLRFPLAGTPLVSVRLNIIENFAREEAAQQEPVRLPPELAQRQHFLYFAKWLTAGRLALIWHARTVNESQVLVCGRAARPNAGWQCERSVTKRAPGGWLDYGDEDITPLDDKFYLLRMPKFASPEVGSLPQVARVSLERPDEFEFVTSGPKYVYQVEGVDLERSLVYYTANWAHAPWQKHLFVTSLPDSRVGSRGKLDQCLTCNLYPGRYMHFDSKVSRSARHLVLQCNGPDVPRTELRKLIVNTAPAPSGGAPRRHISSNLLRTLEDNRELRRQLTRVKAMPETVRLRVPIASTDYAASVKLLLPPLDDSLELELTQTSAYGPRDGGPGQLSSYIERARAQGQPAPFYSLLVDVYAGPQPGIKTGLDYNMTWGHYYASGARTVYAWIEGRGSAFEGSRREFELYHKLGTVEIEDQISVVRDLLRGPLAQLIDPARVGTWGWSYGGYAAGMVLARDSLGPGPGVFACGASSGTLSNFVFYDSAGYEGVMGSPWQNEQFDRHKLGDHLLLDSERAVHDAKECGSPLDAPQANIWHPVGRASDIASRSPSICGQAGYGPRSSVFEDLNERHKNSSLLRQAAHIRDKRYLLLNGLADDNAHIQSTFRLTRQLVEANIAFEQAFFPNHRHSVNTDNASRLHMHRTLARFFARCFESAGRAQQ